MTLRELAQLIDKKDFIKNPMDLIYSEDIELTEEQLMDTLNYIVKHNKEIIDRLKKDNESKIEILNIKDQQTEEQTPEPEQEKYYVVKKEHKDVSDKLDLLFYTLDDNELNITINSLTQVEKLLIKLNILKEINKIKKNIKSKLLSNPLSKIDTEQEDISRYEYILTAISQEQELEEEQVEEYNSKIIFIPNKDTSYIYTDILNYQDSIKDIKNALNKVINGYFLMSKDVKSLVKYDKLNEYKTKTGLRILYVTMPDGYIAICSLFYKDKQKSSKIDSYYEEALNRYNKSKDYLLSNLNNPDFMIEQSILVGELINLLDTQNILKKDGE